MRIAWIPVSSSTRAASARLRCLIPATYLRRMGHEVVVSTLPIPKGRFDIAVFSKTYNETARQVAVDMAAAGTRIVLDLCDNHFYSTVQNERALTRRAALVSMARSAHGIVSSTETLARYIRDFVPDAPPISIVEDPVEDLDALARDSSWSDWIAAPLWRRWRSRVVAHRMRGHIGLVWFGNHGVDYSNSGGMGDLARLCGVLESVSAVNPVYLSVISNNRSKFGELTANWNIPRYYLDWRGLTFGRALRMHDIALIPIEKNPFTECKSANRLALALREGLAVAADSIPSYEPFRDVAALDNWTEGLHRYVADSSLRSRHVEAGRTRVDELFAPDRIGAAWEAALLSVMDERSPSRRVQQTSEAMPS